MKRRTIIEGLLIFYLQRFCTVDSAWNCRLLLLWRRSITTNSNLSFSHPPPPSYSPLPQSSQNCLILFLPTGQIFVHSRLMWESINNSVNVTEYKIDDTKIKDWPADRRLWRRAEEKQGPLSLSQLGVSACKKWTHIPWSQFNPYKNKANSFCGKFILFLKYSSLWSNSLLKTEAPWSQVCGVFRDYGMSQEVIQALITDINEWFCSPSVLCAITQLLLECEKIS